MNRNEFIKCLALFLFSTVFLYGVGETYGVPWLRFHFLGQYNDGGFYFSFSSLTPILGGLLIVMLYEKMIKRLI
ncbi:hypothetical protein ACQKMV_11905 [Lysinibacillus sp. NPDC094403]|uniref:hypothetical protein n=1 Tax=Lysinibacillus sp. NPDC094403 TaxID=3390581 RepID=UPI003D078849